MRRPKFLRIVPAMAARTVPWSEPGVTPAPRALPPHARGWAMPNRTAVIVLSLASAVSAFGGGLALMVSPEGTAQAPAELLLAHTPFESFRTPGLLLLLVVGGSSVLCALAAWLRSRAAIDATLVAGGALTVWILAEVAMLRALNALQLVYGAIGVALLVLGIHAALRSGRARHRWFVWVTGAEALGFLAPVTAGVLSAQAGLQQLPQLFLVVIGGFVEGALLGAGQAHAFPFPVLRRRYLAFTSIAAGLVWTCAMGSVRFAESETGSIVQTAAAALATTIVGLVAIGGAQWLELRHRVHGAWRWITWTALAWLLALPLSFTAGPFVDASTPAAAQLVLWACGGVLMAFVFAVVTWQGVRRLESLPLRERRVTSVVR